MLPRPARLKIGGIQHELDQPVTFLGRDPEACQVAIADPMVSARHAIIVRVDGTFVLYDFKSSNGVRVNGQTVQYHVLRDGDDIDLSSQSKIRFESTGGPPTHERLPHRAAPIRQEDVDLIRNDMQAALARWKTALAQTQRLFAIDCVCLPDEILRSALEIVPADLGMIFSHDPTDRSVRCVATRSTSEATDCQLEYLERSPLVHNAIRMVAESRAATLYADFLVHPGLWTGGGMPMMNIRSAVVAPFGTDPRVAWAIFLMTRMNDARVLDAIDRDCLEALAGTATVLTDRWARTPGALWPPAR